MSRTGFKEAIIKHDKRKQSQSSGWIDPLALSGVTGVLFKAASLGLVELNTRFYWNEPYTDCEYLFRTPSGRQFILSEYAEQGYFVEEML